MQVYRANFSYYVSTNSNLSLLTSRSSSYDDDRSCAPPFMNTFEYSLMSDFMFSLLGTLHVSPHQWIVVSHNVLLHQGNRDDSMWNFVAPL